MKNLIHALEYIHIYWIKPAEPRLKNKSNIKKKFKKMLCMLLNKASYTKKPLYANEFTTSGNMICGFNFFDTFKPFFIW